MIGSQQGLHQDPTSMVAFGHKSVVNRLTANTHSIQIPHPLSEGMGTFEAVFTYRSEEYAILAGCGLSRSSCCRTGHCLENLLKSKISVKLQKQDVLNCEVETHGMAHWGTFSVRPCCKTGHCLENL